MSIRIIPQDQLEKSDKRTAEVIPPLLFPRLKNLYNRRAARRARACASWLKIIRWAITCVLPRLSRMPRRWCCMTTRWRWI
ncbi:formate dehydrogenase formation protein FdhE [Cronobacter universalis NCTC 9529]|nr:formate dehydrogenase formation protein FdhE [Cronobacter universalis NCTC 9529]